MGIGDWGLAQSPIPNPHLDKQDQLYLYLNNLKIFKIKTK